jgi:hypothetical protein
MGVATTIVVPDLRDTLRAREDFTLIRDVVWCHEHWQQLPGPGGLYLVPEKHFLEFMHPDAPSDRHVEVILDEEGLRFKPYADE